MFLPTATENDKNAMFVGTLFWDVFDIDCLPQGRPTPVILYYF